MHSITREFHFCYGHRLLHYEGKCAHPHGHNGRVEITLASETLDVCGMVLDFSELKRVVNDWVEENLDHKMVLADDDPLVPVLAAMQEPMYLMPCPPTAENLSKLIFNLVKGRGYPVSKVVFWETDKCSATYSP
ncbi:MAG: 6-carboxytetrahydropterin synthase [Planctomycetaceae bacterium]|nr:6-carboxytetrahydropterin synthase [Planctomycetaceae bacterium]